MLMHKLGNWLIASDMYSRHVENCVNTFGSFDITFIAHSTIIRDNLTPALYIVVLLTWCTAAR